MSIITGIGYYLLMMDKSKFEGGNWDEVII
jgi:hypothetical protein